MPWSLPGASEWGNVRHNSAVHLLIGASRAAPVLTASTPAELISRSFRATSQAIGRLVEAGVLVQVNVERRNRFFEVRALIEALPRVASARFAGARGVERSE